MDHLDENVENFQLAKSLDELEITKEAVTEELNSLYKIIPSYLILGQSFF
jgi:hypothetical protein